MSTTFAAFLSTGVTLAYSCVRLEAQERSWTVWIFFDGCPMLTNGVEAVS